MTDNIDRLIVELTKPVPWYIDIYYFLRYRAPFRLQCAYWWVEAFIQRGNRGYSDSDWWVFYVYLATVISSGLDKLANEGHGYPSHMTPQEWSDTLIKIKHACDKILYLEKEGIDPSDQDRKEITEAFKLLGENIFSVWD